MSILSLVERVPAVIWSAVIASLLAFGGVLLSNSISLRSLNRKMSYDAEEAARQRKSDIRKEIYLDAAAQMVKANVFLSILPSKPLPRVDLDGGLTGLNVAAAKLQLLMKSESAILVGDIVASYAKIYIRALPKQQPIHALNTDIEFKTDWLQRIQSEISRILSLQITYNELGNADQKYFERLQRSFEDQQGLYVQVSNERNVLWKQLLPLQRDLSLTILEELKATQSKSIKLLIAMRDDFEVSSEADIFFASAEKNMREVMDELTSSLARIDEQL